VPDPAAIAPPLLAWYDAHGRSLPWRGTGDLYRIWVSELMLQQTRVDTVLRRYPAFLDRFPDLASLAAADEDEVLAAWSGLGYYRRARALHRGARRIIDELDGVFPTSLEALMELPGVGRYTAGAILSAGLDLPLPILDGNVIRVLSRLFEIAEPVDRAIVRRRLWSLAEAVLPGERPGDFNQALMDLGATVCVPKGPDCATCPLAGPCGARASGRQSELPSSPRRSQVVHEERVAVVLRRDDGRLLLERRPPDGLLAGMWEPVAAPRPRAEEPEAVACRLAAATVAAHGRVEHRFSHRHWTIHVFSARAPQPERAAEPRAERRWVHPDQLDELGIPTVTRKVLAAAGAG